MKGKIPKGWWAEYRTDWAGGWHWRVGAEGTPSSIDTRWEWAPNQREAFAAARVALGIIAIMGASKVSR